LFLAQRFWPAPCVPKSIRRLRLWLQVAEHPLADFGIIIGNFRHNASEPFERRTPSRGRRSISPA
jgi:hypothetical protein